MGKRKMSMYSAKKRLAMVWLGGASFLFLVLVVQSLFNHYGDRVDQAWGGLLPTIMPTLALIVAVYAAEARGRATSKSGPVDRFTFQLALGLSAFYLLVVSATILVEPFVMRSSIELMQQSNLYLGPLQGVVSAVIGIFFVLRDTAAAGG